MSIPNGHTLGMQNLYIFSVKLYIQIIIKSRTVYKCKGSPSFEFKWPLDLCDSVC